MQNSMLDLLSLADRVEKLERQNRLLKRAGLALLFLPAALVVMGQSRPNGALEAQRFVLTDSSGIKRAELAVLDAGPILRFLDSGGQAKAILSANGYTIFGSGMRAFGKGKDSIQAPNQNMSLGPYGLDFSDERGKAVIQLGGVKNPAPPSISPSLQLFDSNEKSRVELSGRSDFGPGVWLSDESGFPRVSLGLTREGPYVIVNDSGGFSAQLGTSNLVTAGTGEQHKTSAASLVLLGGDGKVLWRAP